MSGLFSVVGLNHGTAPVEVREAVSPRASESGRLCAAVREAAGLRDAVVLSTCSRFEVYASTTPAEQQRLAEWLCARAGRGISDMLYLRRGADAVRHLFRVTGGLDSWIVGETEILGQVKSAYQGACSEKTASRAAHLAFQRALFAGKKVRNDTRIVGGIASVAGAASILARRIFADLRERKILVFGAGTMAAATVRHLCAKGVSGVWVANRSIDKAALLAAELDGIAMSLADGLQRLDDADVAIVSTAADSYLIDAASAQELSRRRKGRPLFVIDLAVPRNVDPGAAKAEGICLYDIDDLKRLVEESLTKRAADMALAERIVASECDDCWSRIVGPVGPQPIAGALDPRGA